MPKPKRNPKVVACAIVTMTTVVARDNDEAQLAGIVFSEPNHTSDSLFRRY